MVCTFRWERYTCPFAASTRENTTLLLTIPRKGSTPGFQEGGVALSARLRGVQEAGKHETLLIAALAILNRRYVRGGKTALG